MAHRNKASLPSSTRVKSKFCDDVKELGRLLKETMLFKQESLKACKNEVNSHDPKVIALTGSIAKARSRQKELLKEQKNLKIRLQDQSAKPKDKEEIDQLQYRILRKLNQDSAYGLNQLKEAVMQLDEYYD